LHATPPVPHEVADSPESGSHTPLLQQPAHAAPPHVHMPALHAPPPEHMPHATPPVPHSDEDCDAWAMHCPVALQQPFAQDAASQTHCPAVLHA
jgi:hypothetical protein